MGSETKIEWAEKTFNPWIGCTKVGPGCDHCYAETFNNRFGGGNWGPGAPRRRTSPANWKEPIKWNKQAEALGVRFRVFCASLADVFDNEVPDQWRMDLFKLIADTPYLDWLLLTKRIGNVMPMCGRDGLMFDMLDRVWLGATVVNQAEANRDIPKLLQVPARVRWLSIEPLLGPIDLTAIEFKGELGGMECWDALDTHGADAESNCTATLDWVVVGGESGTGARAMHPEWVRSIRNQCQEAGTPFLFKQWGDWAPQLVCASDRGAQNALYLELDGSVRDARYGARGDAVTIQRNGKKATGRSLDGRTWDQYPITERELRG